MKILVFGATGSIGSQLMDVIKPHQLVGITFNNNIKKAQAIIKKYHVPYYFCHSNQQYSNVKDVDVLINKAKPDLIVNAIVGSAGLKITIKAIKAKINLALANKESLVMAGYFIQGLNKKYQIKIYPIDSEHSSLYQLIKDKDIKSINELLITCSGGSVYNKSLSTLKKITFNEVIQHPNWNMGYKISIDSATLINKCFEIVEAYWLFGIKNIIPILHKQSIIHGMVNFKDGSYLMYASYPDMKLPIKLAINQYCDINLKIKPIDFKSLNLTFDYIDEKKYLPIKWAQQIINDENHVLGVIINAANDLAIELFKNKKISFLEIIPFIQYYIKKYHHQKIKNIDDIFYLLDKIIYSNYEQVISYLRNNKTN